MLFRSVGCGGNPQISLQSNQVQCGGTDQNWSSKWYYDGSTKMRAWNSSMYFSAGFVAGTGRTISFWVGTGSNTSVYEYLGCYGALGRVESKVQTCLATSSGNVGIGTTGTQGYKLYTYGSTGASGTKYFDIVHPDPVKKAQNYRLRHGAVEAPAFGENLYRFTVTVSSDGETVTTDLPSYFPYLNEKPQLWTQARAMFAHAYGEVNENLTSFTLTGEKAGEYDVLIIVSRKQETTDHEEEVFIAEYKESS